MQGVKIITLTTILGLVGGELLMGILVGVLIVLVKFMMSQGEQNEYYREAEKAGSSN